MCDTRDSIFDLNYIEHNSIDADYLDEVMELIQGILVQAQTDFLQLNICITQT